MLGTSALCSEAVRPRFLLGKAISFEASSVSASAVLIVVISLIIKQKSRQNIAGFTLVASHFLFRASRSSTFVESLSSMHVAH